MDRALVLMGLVAFVTGCGQRQAVTDPVRAALAPAGEAPSTPPATLAWASHRAERHLVAGIDAYESNRPAEAREEFAAALRAFDAPGIDVHSDSMTRAAYERLLDRVSQYDVDALDSVREETPLELLGGLEFDLRRPNPAAEAELRAAMESIDFDVPVQVTEEVLAVVNYFRTRNRRSITAGIARSGRYIEMMREIFRKEGLPQDLVYMVLVESNYKPQALSRARAKGLWQFIPATGRRYDLEQSRWIDERADPEKATRAAAAYLRDLYAMFGDWNLAMAAYNCGEMRIVRELRKRPGADYWDLIRRHRLPRETRNYVPAILAGMIVSKNPLAFGLQVERDTPIRYDSVVLPSTISLRTVAELTQTSVTYLRELNPELRRARTPRFAYSLKVPPGRGSILLARVANLPPERFATYTIKRGDTLSRIARRLGVSMYDLADWNGMSLRTTLGIGTVLDVPPRDLAAKTRKASTRSASAAKPANDRSRVSGTSGTSGSNGRKLTYRVRKGDTLYKIAKRYNISVNRLASWNAKVGRTLYPGDLLTIYVK